ncbi:hypothetical protein BDD12DRAFT_805664 [Trichophaea hybrida]|nr:hypothetical protein BDD12DRAFT_805664 [Trichophaea hybrida]
MAYYRPPHYPGALRTHQEPYYIPVAAEWLPPSSSSQEGDTTRLEKERVKLLKEIERLRETASENEARRMMIVEENIVLKRENEDLRRQLRDVAERMRREERGRWGSW